jgi:hypothetical protein
MHPNTRANRDNDGSPEVQSQPRKRVRRPNDDSPDARLAAELAGLQIQSPYQDDISELTNRMERLHMGLANRYVPLPVYLQQDTSMQTTENAGDRRFAGVRRTWSEFRDVSNELIEPSDTQGVFLMAFLNACTQAIYGRDYEAAAERILKQNGWTEFSQEVFVIAARADGKTFAVAMFMAAVLINCPGIRMAVFGHSQRGSDYVLALVGEMIRSHPEGRRMIVRIATEKIELRGPEGELDKRIALALPNNENTTRGTQVKMIFVDEMAFISESLLMGTLVPMLSKKETSIIGISTPLGDDNIYTWVTRMEDTTVSPPKPLFNVVSAGRVCPACVAANKVFDCTHMRFQIPPWKSLKKVARMKVIYDEMPHIRENLGGIANSDRRAFRAVDVDNFFRNITRNIERVKCVWLASDPSGGGPSEFAVVGVVEDMVGRLSVRITNRLHIYKFTDNNRVDPTHVPSRQ